MYVLSFLTIKEAAKTSVLSKRWVHLWKQFSGSLDFNALERFNVDLSVNYDDASFVHRYIEWVNKVIDSHQGPNIREFLVLSDLGASSASDIDRWIEFAIEKRVERLQLDFLFRKVNRKPYVFSPNVYNRMRNSCIPVPGASSFSVKSLRYLYFVLIQVSGEHLEFFLLNCPFLEELCVEHSDYLVSLRVSGISLQLKLLHICYCFHVKNIEISAPELVSFKYRGQNTRLCIMNAPKLIDVCVGGSAFRPTTDALTMLSDYLPQLETFYLDMVFVEVNKDLTQSLKLPNLKNLTLGVHAMTSDSVLGWTFLLKTSPSLQKFRLELRSYGGPVRTVQKAAKCPHQCLRVVEFVGFVGYAIDVELFEYFVENAPSLEKFVIYCDNPAFLTKPWLLSETSEKISARKRAGVLRETLPPGIELLIY